MSSPIGLPCALDHVHDVRPVVGDLVDPFALHVVLPCSSGPGTSRQTARLSGVAWKSLALVERRVRGDQMNRTLCSSSRRNGRLSPWNSVRFSKFAFSKVASATTPPGLDVPEPLPDHVPERSRPSGRTVSSCHEHCDGPRTRRRTAVGASRSSGGTCRGSPFSASTRTIRRRSCEPVRRRTHRRSA